MPGCQHLESQAREGPGCNARVAVLFSNGHFGVWELDQHNELQFVSRDLLSAVLKQLAERTVTMWPQYLGPI